MSCEWCAHFWGCLCVFSWAICYNEFENCRKSVQNVCLSWSFWILYIWSQLPIDSSLTSPIHMFVVLIVILKPTARFKNTFRSTMRSLLPVVQRVHAKWPGGVTRAQYPSYPTVERERGIWFKLLCYATTTWQLVSPWPAGPDWNIGRVPKRSALTLLLLASLETSWTADEGKWGNKCEIFTNCNLKTV